MAMILCFFIFISSLLMSNSYYRCMNDPNLMIRKLSDLTVDCEDERIPINFGLGKEKIIYLDQDIVVVHKPPHALSVPSVRELDCVAKRIANVLEIPRVDQIIVHRLDYATSGILVFARNYPTLTSLNHQFRKPNLINKSYLAVVYGRVKENEGDINLPLGRDLEKGSPYGKVCLEGKESFTYWKNVLSVGNKTILRLIPRTGRTHQLRLHCAAIGHPILGDYFYAPKRIYNMADRLLLHAEYLSFIHPRTRDPIGFRIPIIASWQKYLKLENDGNLIDNIELSSLYKYEEAEENTYAPTNNLFSS